MRRICTLGLSALCLMIITATPAIALIDMEPCESEADCQDGWTCEMQCETMSSEDAEDALCEGFCMPGDGDSSQNECESNSDCPTGFECIEHTSWGVITSSDEGPSFAEAPCREGEDCGDQEKEEPDSGAPFEPTETENTVKICEPKVCDTDADCEGGLVCVLETYECPEAVQVLSLIHI